MFWTIEKRLEAIHNLQRKILDKLEPNRTHCPMCGDKIFTYSKNGICHFCEPIRED